MLFGWGNEFGERLVDVPSFNVDRLPITNAEFFDFVDSGAYDNELYWRPKIGAGR
jgi:formylglycine-generating enzyme required for sulfatase activity